ncbi:hypothetical protein J3E69DRAFT_332714 [Trichoderma sp. SZMC 28015]
MSSRITFAIPGNGSDELCVGQVYILSILNTNEVLTAVNRQDLKLRPFNWDYNQRWRLDPHIENRHTFVNIATGNCLGTSPQNAFLWCRLDNFWPSEQFTFIPQKTGGYHLYNHANERPRLVTRQGNEDSLCTTAKGNAFVTIGVHRAE